MANLVNTKLITDYINNNNMSKTQFCKKYRICMKTLTNILSESTNFNLISLFKIVKTLNIRICDIFTKQN